MVYNIGVLALQGAFAKHLQMLESIHVPAIEVRYPQDLESCIGLIIPGGESTAMNSQLEEYGLLSALKSFAIRAPVFGTCAGMILMAQQGWLDISLERNAYGRQIDSFATQIQVLGKDFHAIFIRAPRITKIHTNQVEILAKHLDVPVLVRQNDHLAAAFHPELTNDPSIHQYFIQICKEKQLPQLQ